MKECLCGGHVGKVKKKEKREMEKLKVANCANSFIIYGWVCPAVYFDTYVYCKEQKQ